MGMSSLIASFASTCTLRRYARGPQIDVVGLVIQHTAEPAWEIGVTTLVPAGYCVSAACLDHGGGTGCKQPCTSPLARLGCCCRAWFPLLENGTTRRTKAAGALAASFLWRFQAVDIGSHEENASKRNRDLAGSDLIRTDQVP
jgi:hypothetical protein